MGADEKIGQHSGAATTLGAVTLKYLAGEKQCCAWTFYEIKPTAGKHTINVLDTRVADRELRIHYGVDQNGAARCSGVELTQGPTRPFGIICCNVEEYIRVDQRHRLSPRLSAMIASVVSPLVAVPRIRSKRLGLTVRLPTLRRKARPSSGF
jgi:hypothetical protein